MNIQKHLSQFEKVWAIYNDALNMYSDEEFALKPADDEWSIGQMYQHLIGSLHLFHAKQVEACLASNENEDKSKTMPGRISYFLGSMPPIKIKVPASPQYTPPQPASVQNIKEKMPVALEKVRELAQRLQTETSKGKTKHPAFGYVNAAEWFAMIDMHYRHHLRQKGRLDKFLGKS